MKRDPQLARVAKRWAIGITVLAVVFYVAFVVAPLTQDRSAQGQEMLFYAGVFFFVYVVVVFASGCSAAYSVLEWRAKITE